MRIKRVFPYIILAVIFIILSFFWYQYGQNTRQVSQELKLPVVTIRATQMRLERSLRLTGFMESRNQVTVLPRIGGTLTVLFAEVGDSVQAGQVLAQIDPEMYQITLNQIEAAYRAAESTFNRIQRLYNSGASSEEQFNNARAQYESLQSQYQQAQLQFDYTRVSSPVTGTVLIRHVNEGALVGSQVPLFTIGSLDMMQTTIQVPEEYYRYFADENSWPQVRVSLASGYQVASARVQAVAPFISPQSRSFEVSLTIEADANIRPGMISFVDVLLNVREESWSLPVKTVGNSDSLWYVDENSTAHSLLWEPAYYDNDRIAIPDQWSGYNFIIEGQHFLNEGQEVNVLGESDE